MHQDEELHEQLMKAFREYFKANQEWMAKGTRRAGMDTRHWLTKLGIYVATVEKQLWTGATN